MADKIQLRRDLAANWTSANPVLAQGEMGLELDTDKTKVGDGVTDWNTLGYFLGDDQIALEVPVTPTGGLTSINVQAALEEHQSDIDSLSSGAVTDHGDLSGLGDDDHPQYLNDTRHDNKSVGDHSDVDLITNAPIINDLLTWDGANWIPTSTDNAYTIFPIWAEEGGTLSNNNRQWSFGNGAVGDTNITIPINCEVFAMSMGSERGGTSVSIDLMVDNATIETSLFTGINGFVNFNTPVDITAGQIVGFRTSVVVGTYSDSRVCAWFRVRSSALSTSILNDLLDVDVTGITPNQILQYNGSNYTPINLDAISVGLGNVDNTSDLDKPVSTLQQAALDLKYDSSNPSGYITTTSISDFETTTQLNNRDVANRDRTNHTGTQLAATISDLSTAIQNNETNTSLNIIGNTLRYIGEDGTNQDVDLSLYLDDTNASRITSGVLSAGTGIITFTRDDASTFTIDASELLDNQIASEVPVTPSGNLTATNVQGALDEIQSDVDTINSATYVNSVNGETGIVEDVAKTDEANVFTESQTISNTTDPQQLIIKHAGTALIGFQENGVDVTEASVYYKTGTNQLVLGSGLATNDILGINVDDNTIQGFTRQAKNFGDPTDAQDLLTKNYFDLRNDAVKVRSTLTGNLNTGISTFNNFTTTDELGSTLGQFSFATDGITPNFTGTVDITFNIEFSGAVTRSVVGFRWAHNSQNGTWTRNTYIRNGSGHTESSAHFATTIAVTAGLPIQIEHVDFAETGTIISPANGAELVIRRRS